MKLFKKVMASVLAGVLALSMVACGTVVEPELPEDPGAEVTNSAAVENILKYMNEEVREDLGGKKIVNDAELAKYAELRLEVVYQNATTKKEDFDAQSVFTKLLLDNGINTKADVKFYKLSDSTAEVENFVKEMKTGALVYTGDGKDNQAAKDFGKSNAVKDAKVGIATKTIGGKTYVLIATEAVKK